MLRLAHTRLPHALTSVKGRRRCPDLALLRRRALGVCRERRALRVSTHTARTAMPATPWPATHTHGHTGALHGPRSRHRFNSGLYVSDYARTPTHGPFTGASTGSGLSSN